MTDEFIRAIREMRKVRVTFFSREDQAVLARVCAPMDFGPSRRAKEQNDRYHLWDYESDVGVHTLSINPDQLQTIDVLEEHFDPAEFVTWDTKRSPWFVPRDWGRFS